MKALPVLLLVLVLLLGSVMVAGAQREVAAESPPHRSGSCFYGGGE
jgi:hypothetical protein